MFRNLKILSVIAALTCAPAAFAQGGGSGGTNVGVDVSAGASAEVNQTNNGIGAASIGASNCANGLVLGPVGVTNMDKTCKARTAADYWAARGNYTLADEVMRVNDPMTKEAIKSLEKKAKKSDAPTASTKAADDTARDTFWYGGKQYRLVDAGQIKAFNACHPVAVKSLGVSVLKNGCRG